MATTTPLHVDSSIARIWANRVLADQLRGAFWEKMVGGEGSRSPIIRQTDLVGKPGDSIVVQITSPLSGAGVAGDETTLEGSEENLSTSDLKVIPLLYRHGVRTFRRAQKKSMIDLRNEAKSRLREWGSEKMDDVRFELFVASGVLNGEPYTPNTLAAGTGNVVPADVAAGDALTVAFLQVATLTMYNNRAIPLRSADDGDMFGLVASPNSLHALKRETEYRDWVREAEVRGKENPFFRGAVAMIDGVVIHRHNNVPVAADGTGSIDVSRNIMFGAEAFIEGLDEAPSWAEDTFDYGNQLGVAYAFAFQPRRALAKNSLILYADSEAPA